ncbi:MAG: proline--tRNA ligase [Candidatus Kapaibacterium sp.]
MRQSKYFLPTLKELGSDAVMPSHQLMLRAGLVRQVASGVFSWLPMGYKVLKKIMDILREEMDSIGGQEFLLPALNPIEVWEETNRVKAMGDVMFHIKNRPGLVLAPTHEEIITYHARQHVKSYRDMPLLWYQIQNKFRNEPRPKSGVLRGRQFIMKDAYSLDTTWEGLDESYNKNFDAYHRIFERCGLKIFVVGASSGAMGGRQSQEFMVESQSGEDTCAINDESGYAANVEVATSIVDPVGRIEKNDPIEEFATPGAKTINDLIEQFGLNENRCAKSVVYIADSEPLLILMRGNDELNESKLESVLGTGNFRPAEPAELLQYTGANAGSIGPVGLKTKMRVIADNLLKDANGLVSGANKDGFHLKNIDFSRDCKIDHYYDLRTVKEGEPDPVAGKPLRIVKAIELGHIFKLGTKYSDSMGAKFLDADGREKPIIMGSYGIGVERILACFIEQNHDDSGIIWKAPISPFHAHIIGLNMKKFDDVKITAEDIYDKLNKAGFDALIDDRDESPGIKFNDADLIGIPVQIIVGSKNLKNGNLEIKFRRGGERKLIPADRLIEEIKLFYS